jgi:hypothetical protein
MVETRLRVGRSHNKEFRGKDRSIDCGSLGEEFCRAHNDQKTCEQKREGRFHSTPEITGELTIV